MSEKDQPIAEDVQPDVTEENNQDQNEDRAKWERIGRKASAEAKTERQKRVEIEKQLNELRAQIEVDESSKLEERGKFKELYGKANERANLLEKKAAEIKAKYAAKTVSNSFIAEAAKSGASRPDDLLKLVTSDKLIDNLEVDENFNVNEDSLKLVIEQSREAYPYLFGKAAPDIKDSPPAPAKTEKTLENMSTSEKLALLKHYK